MQYLQAKTPRVVDTTVPRHLPAHARTLFSQQTTNILKGLVKKWVNYLFDSNIDRFKLSIHLSIF